MSVNDFWMKDRFICNSLIFTPPRIAQVIVGGLSALFLIQLPLSAAKLRQFLFNEGNKFRIWSLLRSVSNQNGNKDKKNITH